MQKEGQRRIGFASLGRKASGFLKGFDKNNLGKAMGRLALKYAPQL